MADYYKENITVEHLFAAVSIDYLELVEALLPYVSDPNQSVRVSLYDGYGHNTMHPNYGFIVSYLTCLEQIISKGGNVEIFNLLFARSNRRDLDNLLAKAQACIDCPRSGTFPKHPIIDFLQAKVTNKGLTYEEWEKGQSKEEGERLEKNFN